MIDLMRKVKRTFLTKVMRLFSLIWRLMSSSDSNMEWLLLRQSSTTTISGRVLSITYVCNTLVGWVKEKLTKRTSAILSLLKCAVPTKYTFVPLGQSISETVLGNSNGVCRMIRTVFIKKAVMSGSSEDSSEPSISRFSSLLSPCSLLSTSIVISEAEIRLLG